MENVAARKVKLQNLTSYKNTTVPSMETSLIKGDVHDLRLLSFLSNIIQKKKKFLKVK